jgi:AcrR family transcriptional regulator
MSPRPDVSDERKNQIMNAAEQVFTKKGIDSARMDDIAAQTGLSKGTLYLYYKSKDDLVIAILDRIFKGIFDQLHLRKGEELSATQAIWRFTDEAARDYQRMLHMMPIAYEFLALAFRNTVVQKALRSYFNSYMNALIPIVQKGIDAGEFRPVDANEVALAAGAIFEGTILLWVYDNSRVDPEKHIHTSIKLLLEGIQSHA